MRLFFAYWPSPEKADQIVPWVQRAHEVCGGRMMRTDSLHMTLAFLGPASAADVRRLAAACMQWTLPSGSMILREPGRFPKAKVVWLGPATTQPSSLDWLYQANRRLWALLAPLGWKAQESVFRPHVSLLRNAGPGELATLKGEGVDWTPERCVLVASEPASTHSRYTVLAEIPLAPEAP